MKFAIITIVFLITTIPANPVIVTFFSEIQTSPDSLERLEIHPYNWSYGYPFDLSGFRLVTKAGTTYVNQGVVVENENSYVVLDQSNMNGIFSLGDDSDTILLSRPNGDSVWAISYPSRYRYSPYGCWAPESGMSCAIYQGWTPWPDPTSYYLWFIDSTPTFGLPNDDTLGGIYGRVFSIDSTPLGSVWVSIAGPHGGDYYLVYTPGIPFEFHPTGPGIFEVSATKDGYAQGFYPESVRVGANETRTGIDIYLEPLPLVKELISPLNNNWHVKSTIVSSELTVVGTGRAFLINIAGKKIADLVPGANDISHLSPGIYFLRLRKGYSVTKVVVQK
ncbi:MAG: T9SS type A sorting domain-containing protein [bacterium]